MSLRNLLLFMQSNNQLLAMGIISKDHEEYYNALAMAQYIHYLRGFETNTKSTEGSAE